VLSAAMGLVMIGFELFEVSIIDRFGLVPGMVVQQVLMSGLGLAICGLAFSLWMSEYRQQHFPTRHLGHA